MKVVGLIGGIASGKSRAAKALIQRGAVCIDADRIGHLALDDRDVIDAVRERFGPTVFTSDGQIDRKTLSKLVFPPRIAETITPQTPAVATSNAPYEDNRKWLEELLHPRIRAAMQAQLAAARNQGAPAAVLDAPLLLEAGWNRVCDEIWFIDAPDDVRLARAQQRGWSEDEFRAREATQQPLDWKRAQAHKIMLNTGSPTQLDEQLAAAWRSLLGDATDGSA